MAPLSSSASSFLPKGNTGTEGVRLQNDLQGGYRGVLLPKVSGEIVLRTEAGFHGEAGDPRLVVPEQVCQVQPFQDDDHGAGVNPSSPWGFHLCTRSVRCFLAHPNRSPVLSLPRVCSRPQTVSLLGNAIHEVSQLRCQGPTTSEDSSSGLS